VDLRFTHPQQFKTLCYNWLLTRIHQHVNNIASKCFTELRRIKCYRRLLPLNAARTLVNSLVVSKIDYCNCLLVHAPKTIHNKLQNVMNAAARIICGLQKVKQEHHLLTAHLCLPALGHETVCHPTLNRPIQCHRSKDNLKRICLLNMCQRSVLVSSLGAQRLLSNPCNS